MAESHPVGFHWPVQAQQRGAVVIHVDPRYTRTSAVADVFVKIRPGTDIAFLGGIIRYILEHERYFKEYVVHYTNGFAGWPWSSGFCPPWAPQSTTRESCSAPTLNRVGKTHAG